MLESLQDISHVRLFTLGGSNVTVGGVVAAAVFTTMFMLGAWLIGHALRRLRLRTREGNAALYIVEKLTTYGLVLFGLVAGLSTLGLNLSSIAVFAGGLGIGLGLGQIGRAHV